MKTKIVFLIILWLNLSLIGKSLATNNNCDESYVGETSEFGYRCNGHTLICNNVTTSIISEQRCSSRGYCYKFTVLSSNISTVDSNLWSLHFCPISIITLSNCFIETISKDAFTEFSLLKLNLERNKIKNLEFLEPLTSLISLNLTYNELIRVNANDFEQLQNLTYLSIAHNNLTFIGSNSYRLKRLTEFYLNNNNIVTIEPTIFQNLNKLTILNLSDNKLKLISGNMFYNLSNLQELYLQRNRIKLLDSFSFTNLTQLKTLDISYNNLSTIVSNTFLRLNALKKLNLKHNKIFTLTPDSFRGLDSLKLLVMTENLINDIPLGTFNNLALLDDLQLGYNHLNQFTTGTFSNLENLHLLNLSHNKFQTLDESIFYPLHMLNSLYLNHNMLSNINYTSLSEHTLSFQYISIHDNNWNCKFLINMLKVFKLKRIFLSFETQNRKYNEENVEGIACSTSKPEDSSYHNTTLGNIHGFHPEDSFKFSSYIQNSDKIMKELVNEIKKSGNSDANLVLGILKLINATNNSNEKNVPNVTPNYTIALYLILLISILILGLLGFNTYKKYYKSKFNRNQKRRSEMELINSI